MKAKVYITPKDGILDPQGETVGQALRNLGIDKVAAVRVGKFIEIELPGLKRAAAEKVAREACERLLVNPNIESYVFEIVESG